ncbi:hypothetical protein [Nocardioides sp.]|uniref:hypothetical protein n=1 Tax=Nocardioides sp. TaxID=35761 RepID=UPI00272017C1|nr:hypothetical protein [Nocardioides sp.]MDO9458367.1 hypothetical protein [Nocardioides sp.]
MPARRLPQPTYANVMATLAVLLSLGTGTAYAAGLAGNSVKSRHIATNAVTQRHIANNAVRAPDLANGVVGSRSIADSGVEADDLGTNAVGQRAIADSSIGSGEMASNSVGKSELKAGTVDSSKIQDETITGSDIEEGAISSTRMTTGVRNLLFNAGVLAVNKTFADVSVSNSSWPGGAPASGAQLTATWTQPANTLDVVSGFARVAYPTSCSQTASPPGRGLDVKIADAGGRVISASSAQRTESTNYNGNGFWAEQADLPGVEFHAPFGSDLANSPDNFVDYIHLPFELAETVTGGSTAERSVKVFLKRSSSNCTPEVTDARILVYRYTLP